MEITMIVTAFVFVSALIGEMAGYIIAWRIFRSKAIGSLRVDNSDPDSGPYLFLEIEKNPELLYRKKYVTFKVDLQDFISHE